MSTVHICSFTSGLDEMKRREQRDPLTVLRALAARRRFSSFEASANMDIARTITKLFKWGLVRSTGGAYPWTAHEITEKGRAALDAGKVEPPRKAAFICRDCGRKPGRHVIVHGDGPEEAYTRMSRLLLPRPHGDLVSLLPGPRVAGIRRLA
jgi:hypothetical protein